jgi:hypothetical protein
MPHHKNHMKLTGDTHPPEVEDLVEDTRIVAAEDDGQARVYADGYVPRAELEQSDASLAAGAVDELGRKTARSPWMMLGMTLAAGFVLAKLLRR